MSAVDDEAARSDEELLAALRAGDDTAYETLWTRHVGAARRAALRIAPRHVDDLVSEAFLAIYTQVRVRGGGPTHAFRAYLFTVMRNTAARWRREDARFVVHPDAEIAVEEEGLRSLEREYDGALLLSAFRALPERWQRVLWLSEVENVQHSAIAAELGVRSNALSALRRRARKGLRVQWLHQLIPVELRDDPGHAARALPGLIVGEIGDAPDGVASHLASCEACRSLDAELRATYRAGRKSVASIGGLGALGVVLPGAASLGAPPVTAVAAGLVLAGSAAVIAGALSAGLVSGLLAPWTQPPATDGPVLALPEAQDPAGQAGPTVRPAEPFLPMPRPTPGPGDTGPRPAPIETIDIPAGPGDGYPARPAPTSPAAPGTVTEPGAEPAAPAPAVALSRPSSVFLAPRLAGTAEPASIVAVAIDGNTYTTDPAPTGDWAFDLRTVPLDAATHVARVWTVTDGVASAASAVEFTIEPLGVEGIDEYHPITLRDGMGDGLLFTLHGAPGGSVCLDSDTGQSAIVPLDGTGTARRILRFSYYGMYVFRLTPCDAGYYGPDTGRLVSVVEGVFDPYVVDDVQSWEISEE